MLLIFVLYTSPATDPVVSLALWYIQSAFDFYGIKPVSKKFILAGVNYDVTGSGSLSSVSDEVCSTLPKSLAEPVNFSVSIPLKKTTSGFMLKRS